MIPSLNAILDSFFVFFFFIKKIKIWSVKNSQSEVVTME